VVLLAYCSISYTLGNLVLRVKKIIIIDLYSAVRS